MRDIEEENKLKPNALQCVPTTFLLLFFFFGFVDQMRRLSFEKSEGALQLHLNSKSMGSLRIENETWDPF